MKTKGKETEKKKRRKEEKRKWLCPKPNSGPPTHRSKALPLGHVEHTPEFVEILLLKPSSLTKREFKDIFQKNDCSFDSEYPTKMHFIAFTCKEWKPNSLGRYGINPSTSKIVLLPRCSLTC